MDKEILISPASKFSEENNVAELIYYKNKPYVVICYVCPFVQDIIDDMQDKFENILVVNVDELWLKN